MRRILVRIGIAVVVLAIVIAGLIGAFFWTMTSYFNPPPPAFDYPKPKTALEAQRQDVDYFEKLVVLDRSYSGGARSDAEERIGGLKALTASLEPQRLRVALMEIAALADNGHTGVYTAEGMRPKSVPLRVEGFADGLYVMRAKDAALLGGRVVAIDGVPVDQAMTTLEALRGGTKAWRRYLAARYVTDQDVLFGTGIAHEQDVSGWTVQTPMGASVSQRLVSYTPKAGEPIVHPERWLSPEPLKGLSDGWKTYAPARPLPLSLDDFDHPFRRLRLPGTCAIFIQLKSNVDVGAERIGDFLRETEAQMRAQPPCAAIVDLRFDGGGDYTNTYAFANRLPGLVARDGPIFVLTSPATFSAGITTVAFIKQAGGARVKIVGENVGDRLKFYSEGFHGCLPHAPACLAYQTGMHDYVEPCRDWRRCYWLNWIYRVRVKTLSPDEPIVMTFRDWSEGRDPVFERARDECCGVGRPTVAPLRAAPPSP